MIPDIQSLILDAIPLSFWVGLITGGVLVAVVWATMLWFLNFVWRHRKVFLIVCAIVVTCAAIMALL